MPADLGQRVAVIEPVALVGELSALRLSIDDLGYARASKKRPEPRKWRSIG